ncbi:hypothetical protein [Janthinobacterium sp. MDB2-8]|uniref:hypothetical protein n=1 Tax=Janthinobacterium sp. MDB2-8 TaxID=1259338 RepID=UPI003F23CC21
MIYTKLCQLPKRESDQWEHAEVLADGFSRRVARFRIDSQIDETLEGFLDEVSDRLSRWQSGYYFAQEIALIYQYEKPDLDAWGFVKQMKGAVIEGELIIRKNDIPISQAHLSLDIISMAKFRSDDVNEWLARVGAGYRLSYPYEDETLDDKSQAAPASEPVTPAAAPTCAPPDALTDTSAQRPGKEPSTLVGKLAIKAALEIECEENRRATAKDVMSLLQEWADNGGEPAVLRRSDQNSRGVFWMTSKYKEKKYSLEACQKTLETWNNSRQ